MSTFQTRNVEVAVERMVSEEYTEMEVLPFFFFITLKPTVE